MNLNACYLDAITQPAEFNIIPIELILDDIKSGKYAHMIEQLPNSATNPNEYKAQKRKLPAWALNGTFIHSVTNDNFQESNNLFHFDIDHLSADEFQSIFAKLMECEYIYALWRSPSGLGLKGLMRVTDNIIHSDADFKQIYTQIETFFLETHNVILDKSCKDIRRLCFVCSDPQIHINVNATPYPIVYFSGSVGNLQSNIKTDEQHQCIERACNIISKARYGEYHIARCRAGYLAGGQIAGGLVLEHEILDALFGISDDISTLHGDSLSEIKKAHKAITDGIKAGKQKPISQNRELSLWEEELVSHIIHFNETHASVVISGKHRILREIPANATIDKRIRYEFCSRSELSLVYANTAIQVNIDKNGHAKCKNHLIAWAEDPRSRSFTGGVVFLPNRKAPDHYYNTWRGYSIEPKQNEALLVPIHDHIKKIICSWDNDLYEYFLNWVAYTLQYPDKPAGSALVLRGDKGCGKGTIGHFLKNIWGNHGLYVSNAKHLVGNFNAHLSDVCFLFADEAFYSGDKQHEGVLKSLITEPNLMIERKGIDATQQPNYLKVFMATNSDFAIPASKDERRYCVFDVSNYVVGKSEYFDNLHKVTSDKDTQAAFLYEMLRRDISQFRTGKIPDSAGLREQRYYSMASHQKWLVDSLNNTVTHFNWSDGFEVPMTSEWESTVPFNVLWKSYVLWCDKCKTAEFRRVSQTLFGRYLADIYIKRRRNNGINYELGTLEEAVLKFEKFEKISISELSERCDF